MKIKISLKLYFLTAMLLLCLTLVVGFSVLTVNYFIEGMDTVNKASMEKAAQYFTNLTESGSLKGDLATISGYTIAKNWHDLPETIHKHILQPPNKLTPYKKHIIRSSILFSPEQAYFAFYMEQMPSNKSQAPQPLYVSHFFVNERELKFSELFTVHAQPVFWVGLLGLTIFILLTIIILLMMQTVTKPVGVLARWAGRLNKDNLSKRPPSFRFNELNELAILIQESLLAVQQSLTREKDFLRYASHELRTPIAIVVNNVELLDKVYSSLGRNSQVTPKEKDIVKRIERASLTMKNLTETLLWLSREQSIALPCELIDFSHLIQQIVEEHQYLLSGKEVNVSMVVNPCKLSLPAGVCRIIVANLVRNAFVHTYQGNVNIKQDHNSITIINNSFVDDNKQSNELTTEVSELGFGLGMNLINQLVDKFGWQIDIKQDEEFYSVTLVMEKPK